jgi:NRPS condensation-like uncharacterized protein
LPTLRALKCLKLLVKSLAIGNTEIIERLLHQFQDSPKYLIIVRYLVKRQLGIMEHIFWLYDQAAPVHFTLTATIVGLLPIVRLQQALARVQQRHPLLNVQITPDRSGHPWFVENSGRIPLRVVDRQSEQQWQREVERELSQPFDWHHAPLIRVVLLHGYAISDLIITCHHSISDGASLVFLLRDILQAVGSPDIEQPTLPKRPPYEQLLPQFTPKQPAKTFEPSLTKTHTISNLPKKSRPRLQAWSLAPEKTIAVIHHCQQERTSVHTAICAAFLLAISQQRTDTQNNQLRCFSPINLRRFLPEIQEDCGFYFTFNVTTHDVTPDLSFWDLARSIKAQLNQKIAPQQIFAHLPKAEAFISILPSAETVKDVLQTANDYDVLVSNLGRLTIPQQYGHLQLTAIYAPSAISHIERDRYVGVNTLGNKMFFNLVYSESNSSPAEIEWLQKTAMQILNVACGSQEGFVLAA